MGMATEISEDPKKKMKTKHALVMAWPAFGHITPLLQLSHMLSSAGIAVTFVNTDFNQRRLLRSSVAPYKAVDLDGCGDFLQTNPVELHVGAGAAPIRLVGIVDGVDDRDYIVLDVEKVFHALIDMKDRLAELALSLRPPITSVIGDIFCICTPHVARRLGVPYVGFWPQSAASYAAHTLFLPSPPAHLKELMQVVGENDKNERRISCIPGCPTLKPTEVISFLQSCNPSDFMFDFLSQIFGDEIMKKSRVVLNSFEALEPEAVEFVKVQKGGGDVVVVMGPVLPDEYLREGVCEYRRVSIYAEEEEECLEWLGKQEKGSVLYVSFGSVVRLTVQQVEELAAGLEGSGCPVLMVARRALVDGQDAAVFPTSFVTSEKVKLMDWAPQLAVLAHPSVGGFLSHAGWNSTLESISNAVPMLCWPYFADQMMNCRCIVDYWNIGLELQPHQSTGLITRDEIQSKVKRLMDPTLSHAMRIRARDLSILAKETRSTPSTSNMSSQSSFQSLLSFLRN